MLKTLVLPRFNVTSQWNSWLPLWTWCKCFRFCFFLLNADIYGVLEVSRTFLDNHTCPRSRKATHKYRTKRHTSIDIKKTQVSLIWLWEGSFLEDSFERLLFLPSCSLCTARDISAASGSFSQDSLCNKNCYSSLQRL